MPCKIIASLLVIQKVVTNVDRWKVNRVHVLHLLKQADCVTDSRFTFLTDCLKLCNYCVKHLMSLYKLICKFITLCTNLMISKIKT